MLQVVLLQISCVLSTTKSNITNKLVLDTPWDCCEVHFRDVHCQFKDICDYYTMRPTPEPTPDPTPEPVEVSVSEPAGEETKREDEPDRRLRRPLMLV